jgi:CO/xanthine dehydrogenase FAD-binding subunit
MFPVLTNCFFVRGGSHMAGWKHYHTPHSIDEALDLLHQHAGNARIVSGGTDLLLELQQGHRPVQEALIDVTHIAEMRQITRRDDLYVSIGAAVTHTQIVDSALLSDRATCLVESCGVVGGPQVRNVGTLGGNVAHALPAGDGTVSLVALDASAEIVKDNERRWVNIREMYHGPGQSLIDPTHDLLLGFRVGLCRQNEASAFKRIMRPQGVALPVLGCAIWLRLSEAYTIEAMRICLAPVAPTPTRLAKTEAVLIGMEADNEAAVQMVVTEACKAARAEINPRTSKYRATAEYRHEMAEVLICRALSLAIERAKSGQAVPEGVGL